MTENKFQRGKNSEMNLQRSNISWMMPLEKKIKLNFLANNVLQRFFQFPYQIITNKKNNDIDRIFLENFN